MGCCDERYKGFKGKFIKASDIVEGYAKVTVMKGKQSKYRIERMKVCQKCEFHSKKNSGWCMACGCWIPAKASCENNICCEGKWLR